MDMNFEDTINNICLLEPIFGNDLPVIVLTSNHENIGESMATIASVVTNTVDEREIDIVVLHSDLDYYDIRIIKYFVNKQPGNIKIRTCCVAHDYNKGYIHIDRRYSDSFINMVFMPYIMKRYQKVIYIESGSIVIRNCDWMNDSWNDSVPFELVCVDDNALAVCYNVDLFRKKYSAKELNDAMTKEGMENTKIYFDRLVRKSGDIPVILTKKMTHRRRNKDLFYKYAFMTPFFEKMIYSSKVDGVNKEVHVKKKFSGVYLFPFEKVEQNSRVVIYGNGNVGKQYIAQIEKTNYCKIVAICDKNASDGAVSVQEMLRFEFDKIVVAIASSKVCNEVLKMLENKGLVRKKIVCENERDLWV